ncbi:MAG: T9SS type A sorting domain-containing protein [Flavobacteriales bacterium]
MRFNIAFLFVVIGSLSFAQGIEMGPVTRNFQLAERPQQLKSTTNLIDSTFFYTPDTLSLPFFDEFSSDKFQKYIVDYSAPGLTQQQFYQLLDPLNLQALPSTTAFTDQATFRRIFDITTSSYTDSIFPTVAVKVGDFTAFPIVYQTLNLYPPYYIYDTIGVPDTPDTVWVQNPSFIQDQATIFFSTLNDPNALWLDNFAYRNARFAVNPRSLGVVTFDGLDQYGFPYAIGTSLTNTADYLHSKPLDLSPYTAEDSLYFSFLVQPQGFGDIPESSDSLIVEFYAKDLDQWIWIWSMPGDTVKPFQVVHIPVTNAQFFKKGFQFRFRNYGALSGSLDHFHIDYVHLRAQSDIADTLFKDFAWVYPINTLLETYTAVPWDHYKASTTNHMSSAVSVSIHNGSSNPENNSTAGQINYSYNGTVQASAGMPGFVLSNGQLNYAPQTTYNSDHDLSAIPFATNLPGDEQVFRVKGSIAAQFPNLGLNDTTGFYQSFSNFYSYDDGSAEAAFGPTGAQARLAIQFDAYEPDSLLGLAIHFVPSVTDVSSKLFLISVWSNENGHPGQLLYEDDVFFPRTPAYGNDRDIFVNYFFPDTQKISVPESFFVGWRQLDPERLNLGLDRNIDHSDKVQYSVDGGFTWYTSPFEGSAMLRPIFSTALDASLGVANLNTPKPQWSCYPNPSSGIVNFVVPQQFENNLIQISNMQGQVVGQSMGAEFDTTSLPDGIYMLQCLGSNMTPLKLIVR